LGVFNFQGDENWRNHLAFFRDTKKYPLLNDHIAMAGISPFLKWEIRSDGGISIAMLVYGE